MTDAPTEPSKEAAVTRSDVWDAIWLWMKSGGDRGKRTEDLNDALDRFRAAGVREERERAAKIADLYADVNIEAAGDSILADPVLSGRDHSQAAFEKSNELSIEGCIHSSMYHAAKNIAERIRAGASP